MFGAQAGIGRGQRAIQRGAHGVVDDQPVRRGTDER